MNTKPWQSLIYILLLAVASADLYAGWWSPADDELIELDVVTDSGRRLPQYPLTSGGPHYRAYLEARDGAEYGLRVRNRSGERIGLVITVDGRNILSGKRSDLTAAESMYVLEPYGRGKYLGWRTGRDQVNRFYFTDSGDSYAGAWGDESAMGVIAVAVFQERASNWRDRGEQTFGSRAERHREDAGTGFGEEVWSPSRRVVFESRTRASAKYFLKYEWRQTLCQLGVSDDCRRRRNRFWPGDEGFAAYPPGHFRR